MSWRLPARIYDHRPAELRADPARHGCRSETVIAVNFTEKLILIGGTAYAGEMKKSVFGILNYLLPPRASCRCIARPTSAPRAIPRCSSACRAPARRRCRPTPKPHADRRRRTWLVGHGVFNFEGGCYAKMIRLSEEAEPEIFATTKRFGTVLENVVIDPVTREIDLDDASLAENSRGSYPIDFIPNASEDNLGPVPKNIIMLTADAYGVLPPIAKLTPGSGDVPLPVGLHRARRGHRNRRHRTRCDLLDLLRRAVHAAPPVGLRQPPQGAHCQGRRRLLAGQHRLDRRHLRRRQAHADQGDARAAQRRARRQPQQRPFRTDPNFGFQVPVAVPGVDMQILNPRETWADKAPMTPRPRRWSACSSTTSRSSRTMSRKCSAVTVKAAFWAKSPALPTRMATAIR
jgi:phosphoenolpyruvate carboxykinase (ATP)